MTSSPCSGGGRPNLRMHVRLPAGFVLLLALSIAMPSTALRGQPSTGPAAEPALRMPVCPAYQNMCVNADKNGVFDMNNGVAELEGDVRGYMGSQDLTFHSDLLRAMRDEAGDWKRLFLSNNVRMAQPNR